MHIVAPRYNEGAKDWQNLLAIPRFRYIQVLFNNYLTISGLKKMICYTENFVLYRLVISRFHCITFVVSLELEMVKNVKGF